MAVYTAQTATFGMSRCVTLGLNVVTLVMQFFTDLKLSFKGKDLFLLVVLDIVAEVGNSV